jgi:hypothetical protein
MPGVFPQVQAGELFPERKFHETGCRSALSRH